MSHELIRQLDGLLGVGDVLRTPSDPFLHPSTFFHNDPFSAEEMVRNFPICTFDDHLNTS